MKINYRYQIGGTNRCITLNRRRLPLPGRGIVGKNQNAWSKTTVRSKGIFPLKVRRSFLRCVPKRCLKMSEIAPSGGHPFQCEGT